MTNNTRAIAALIARDTPLIPARYALVDVPGTELTDANPVHLAFLAAERELGERIGYPALVYQDTPDTSIIGTAADYDQAEMLDYEQRRNTQLEEECGALRADLDDAHQHVGALLKIAIPLAGTHDDSVLSAARAWLRRRG